MYNLDWNLKNKKEQGRAGEEHSKLWEQQVQMPQVRVGFKDWQTVSNARSSEQGRRWQ